jgi:hypothetical protein
MRSSFLFLPGNTRYPAPGSSQRNGLLFSEFLGRLSTDLEKSINSQEGNRCHRRVEELFLQHRRCSLYKADTPL